MKHYFWKGLLATELIPSTRKETSFHKDIERRRLHGYQPRFFNLFLIFWSTFVAAIAPLWRPIWEQIEPFLKTLITASKPVWTSLTASLSMEIGVVESITISLTTMLGIIALCIYASRRILPKSMSAPNKHKVFYLAKLFPQQWQEFEHIFSDVMTLKTWKLQQGVSKWKVHIQYHWYLSCTWARFLLALCFRFVQRFLLRK